MSKISLHRQPHKTSRSELIFARQPRRVNPILSNKGSCPNLACPHEKHCCHRNEDEPSALLPVRTKNTADTATKTNRQPFFLSARKTLLTPHENEPSNIFLSEQVKAAYCVRRTNRQRLFLTEKEKTAYNKSPPDSESSVICCRSSLCTAAGAHALPWGAICCRSSLYAAAGAHALPWGAICCRSPLCAAAGAHALP